MIAELEVIKEDLVQFAELSDPQRRQRLLCRQAMLIGSAICRYEERFRRETRESGQPAASDQLKAVRLLYERWLETAEPVLKNAIELFGTADPTVRVFHEHFQQCQDAVNQLSLANAANQAFADQ